MPSPTTSRPSNSAFRSFSRGAFMGRLLGRFFFHLSIFWFFFYCEIVEFYRFWSGSMGSEKRLTLFHIVSKTSSQKQPLWRRLHQTITIITRPPNAAAAAGLISFLQQQAIAVLAREADDPCTISWASVCSSRSWGLVMPPSRRPYFDKTTLQPSTY